MNETPKPRFTGIFIPVEILEIEELTMLDQLLLSWIDALYCHETGGCYAKNEYLAERLRVKENTIAKSITKLRQLGLIEDVSFDGRNRIMKACIGKKVNECQSKAGLDLNPRQGLTKIQSRVGQKSSPIYVYSKEERKEDKREREAKASPPPSFSSSSANKSQKAEKPKESLGELGNVKLTVEEIQKLNARFGNAKTDAMIKRLDLYLGQKGDKYKSHYATILKWHDDDEIKSKHEDSAPIAKHRQGSKLAFEKQKDTWTPPPVKAREKTPEEKAKIFKEFGVRL